MEKEGKGFFLTLPKANDTVVGPLPNRLHLVSFTGSHGVGKSTLIRELHKRLNNMGGDVNALIVPSASSVWFSQQQTQTPELKKYDDLDTLTLPASALVTGVSTAPIQDVTLRVKMQVELPTVMRGLIADQVSYVHEHVPATRRGVQTYLLVDRWFVDIMAYTSLKVQDPVLARDINNEARSQERQLFQWLLHQCITHGHQLYMTHVLIPAKACDFKAADDKPNRGTDDARSWEFFADRHVFETMIPSRVMSISRSPLEERVSDVLARIQTPYAGKEWMGG